MTTFLCVLTVIALIQTPSLKSGTMGGVLAIFIPWVGLVLGLATLAFLSSVNS